MDWLLNDMNEKLKSWGHHGGERGHLIFKKSDGESAVTAVRDALAKQQGGRIVIDRLPKGESQSNGAVEEAGKTVREFVNLMRDVVEAKTV